MADKNILLLTDYKGFFGSKQNSIKYRGGMDISRLRNLFQENGYSVKALNFSKIDINELLLSRPIVLYTSSEDKAGLYKSYIEDVISILEELHIMVVPGYRFLKAHNNKVYMELLRATSDYLPIKTIHSRFYGSVEELLQDKNSIEFPVVIKPSSGAMGKGVAKASQQGELLNIAREISGSHNLIHDFKEILRNIKYKKNYKAESSHRNKFIVQNFITGLGNDWKVLIYYNKYYVLYRGNRKNDFRASGSGKFEFRRDLPDGLLDFASGIRDYFNIPNISLDIGFDGKNFHLIEFQSIYFGTTTLEKSKFYFMKDGTKWGCKDGKSDLEEIYVHSIVEFVKGGCSIK